MTYGAFQARRLGLRVAAVTSCAGDLRPADVIPDSEWLVLPSAATTTFENHYVAGRREQRLLARAEAIGFGDIPADWRCAPLILLCPVFHEVDPSLTGQLRREASFLALGAQGWLRRSLEGQIEVDPVEAAPAWLGGDAVFVSEDDVLDAEGVAVWRRRVPIVVLTRASRGCTVWDARGRHDVPALAVDEVDPTGAGDVFMTAFVVRYRETGSSLEAAQFAAAAAALAVTRSGVEGIAGRAEIEALRLRREAVRR